MFFLVRLIILLLIHIIDRFITYAQALSSHIVRACNPDESSQEVVAGAVAKIVPLLLEKGLVAPSAEV